MFTENQHICKAIKLYMPQIPTKKPPQTFSDLRRLNFYIGTGFMSPFSSTSLTFTHSSVTV